MTLCNIAISSERALVAADTLGYKSDGSAVYELDGTPREIQKIYPLTHANFVLTGAGAGCLFTHIATQLRAVKSVDEAIERMPALLNFAAATLPLAAPERATFPGNRVCLVGWSKEQGRMIAAIWTSDCGFKRVDAPFLMSQARPGCWSFQLLPDHPTAWTQGLPDDAEKMRDYARHQVEHCRADPASIPYGGRIVLADISEAGITLTTAGNLGIPPQRPTSQLSVDVEQIATDAVTVIDSGAHNSSATPAPSISFDTGYTTVVTATSTGSRPTHVSGNASLSITLPGTTIEQIGGNLLIRRDGTTLLHNKNINGKPSTVSGSQSIQFVMPFDVTISPSAGSHTYEYRWLVNWVNNTAGTVTVTGLSASYDVNMDVIENKNAS